MSRRENSCCADKPSLRGHLYGFRVHSAQAFGGIYGGTLDRLHKSAKTPQLINSEKLKNRIFYKPLILLYNKNIINKRSRVYIRVNYFFI